MKVSPGVEGLEVLHPALETVHWHCGHGVNTTSDDKCLSIGVLNGACHPVINITTIRVVIHPITSNTWHAPTVWNIEEGSQPPAVHYAWWDLSSAGTRCLLLRWGMYQCLDLESRRRDDISQLPGWVFSRSRCQWMSPTVQGVLDLDNLVTFYIAKHLGYLIH